jgi:hypothetical protein
MNEKYGVLEKLYMLSGTNEYHAEVYDFVYLALSATD